MRFFNVFFITRLKLFFTPSFIAALCIFMLGIFCALNVLSAEDSMKIRIGVLNGSSKEEQLIIKYLTDYMGKSGEVVLFARQDELVKSVMRRSVDCGFIASEGFGSNGIELIKTNLTASDQVVGLIVSSAVIQNMSGQLGYSVLKDYFNKQEKERIISAIQNSSDEYIKDGPLMEIIYETMKSSKAGGADVKVKILEDMAAWLIIILTAVMSMLYSMKLAEERSTSIYGKIQASAIGARRYMLYNIMFLFVVNILCSVSTLFIFNSLFGFYSTGNIFIVSLISSITATALGAAFGSVLAPQYFPAATAGVVITLLLTGVWWIALR